MHGAGRPARIGLRPGTVMRLAAVLTVLPTVEFNRLASPVVKMPREIGTWPCDSGTAMQGLRAKVYTTYLSQYLSLIHI